MLEKTLESPWTARRSNQSIHPKGDQFWVSWFSFQEQDPFLYELKKQNKTNKKKQDVRGIGQGDHFLPHKCIKRTFKRWVNSTKQLLNAGRGHQAPRKAAHCLQKELGKTIKDKKRDKRVRDRAPSQEGSLKKREVSKHQEALSLLNLWRALEPQRAT